MENITLIQWFIAFSAMLVTFLRNLNVAKDSTNKFSIKAYFKAKWINMLSTAILLPIILLVCADPILSDILPINNVTAFLAGYQTDSLCDSIVEISKNKIKKDA